MSETIIRTKVKSVRLTNGPYTVDTVVDSKDDNNTDINLIKIYKEKILKEILKSITVETDFGGITEIWSFENGS